MSCGSHSSMQVLVECDQVVCFDFVNFLRQAKLGCQKFHMNFQVGMYLELESQLLLHMGLSLTKFVDPLCFHLLVHPLLVDFHELVYHPLQSVLEFHVSL